MIVVRKLYLRFLNLGNLAGNVTLFICRDLIDNVGTHPPPSLPLPLAPPSISPPSPPTMTLLPVGSEASAAGMNAEQDTHANHVRLC